MKAFLLHANRNSIIFIKCAWAVSHCNSEKDVVGDILAFPAIELFL